jgi:chromosome segregation ATPase
MSEIDPIQYASVLAKAQTADKLEKDNEKLQAKVERLQEEAVKADKAIATFEMGKKEYETLLEAGKREKEKDDKEKAELLTQLKAAKDEKEKDEKDKKEKAEKIEKLEKELSELKTAQQSAERQSMLLKEGVDAKDAEAFAKLYAGFNDEQFKAVAAAAVESHRTKAALEQLRKDGKVNAEDIEKMKLDPVDANKKDDKNDGKGKSRASIFASFSSALPKTTV